MYYMINCVISFFLICIAQILSLDINEIDQPILVSEAANLTCQITTNIGVCPKVIDIHWTHNGKDFGEKQTVHKLTTDTNTYEAKLNIPNVSLELAGEYYCNATINSTSATVQKTRLTVRCKYIELYNIPEIIIFDSIYIFL